MIQAHVIQAILFTESDHDLLTMNIILCCCVRIVEGFGNIVTVGCQGESITTVA